MKLGHERIAVRISEKVGTNDYGRDIVVDVDHLVRWCSVTPTRSSEDSERSAPAVSGATVLAPSGPVEVVPDAVVVWPITGERVEGGRTVYEGRQWQVQGEVGRWPGMIEFQLRRAI